MFLWVIFRLSGKKMKVLGRIGRSGKVLGFISSNFGATAAGGPPKGNNGKAIIIIIIPARRLLGGY